MEGWTIQKAIVQCVCGEVMHLESSPMRKWVRECPRCRIQLEVRNNQDGTGLRFSAYEHTHSYIKQNYYKLVKINTEPIVDESPMAKLIVILDTSIADYKSAIPANDPDVFKTQIAVLEAVKKQALALIK